MKPKHTITMSKLEEILVAEKVWLNREFIHRFNSKVDSSGGPDACWPWLSVCEMMGYGRFKRKINNIQLITKAHRLALILKLQRAIQADMGALHSCDNPVCTNPNHLREGSQKDNMSDCIKHGRFQNNLHRGAGASNANCRLTRAEVIEMRALGDSGMSFASVARKFKTSPTNARNIIKRYAWAHLA